MSLCRAKKTDGLSLTRFNEANAYASFRVSTRLAAGNVCTLYYVPVGLAQGSAWLEAMRLPEVGEYWDQRLPDQQSVTGKRFFTRFSTGLWSVAAFVRNTSLPGSKFRSSGAVEK